MLSLVEPGPLVLEKKFLKNFHIILLFLYYFPLEKDWAFHFFHLYKLESSSPKDILCQDIGPVIPEKKINRNVYRQVKDWQSEKLT